MGCSCPRWVLSQHKRNWILRCLQVEGRLTKRPLQAWLQSGDTPRAERLCEVTESWIVSLIVPVTAIA